MKNNFYNKSLENIYSKPSLKSEVSTQILYGEKFKILSSNYRWVKIKTYYDNYIGFIKKNKFYSLFKPTHKVYTLKSRIYKNVKNKFLPSNIIASLFPTPVEVAFANTSDIFWLCSMISKNFIIRNFLFLEFCFLIIIPFFQSWIGNKLYR